MDTIDEDVREDDIFTWAEVDDVIACALERGIEPRDLMHDAVMNDIYR